ncbi:MAG TPA: hypothetical protein DDW92_03280 [Candidatus Veblenbacteria bacterium]|uniref:Uncharacterized protein n=3 Tax=Candidatus Vebleniibacteriota TaxID=1817921 RepID=A0A1G2QAF4_9BACT|nr:MAG: hypothetical protein A2226_01755 [Candidatus Veblenbacteria bacterium RIFOXYA2_FULL_43_9]OHA56940.1 MAG: hypothetical protein A2441_01765 [Candidatus Veblenbacteria bacterium RIFOXYC2_FULL_42_11]OHA57534.1 MAG: hypothetical protein A2588_00575 [Candidatus Veblenbacteria bacterium RIFOXYD1_FULL_43_11]HBH17259.1 hypothetical protein [Candidatus Veblenbacteria bacterium]HCX38690.1 hypothetical protein [Candidatus Veblenbacteria bacterium]
MLRLDKAAFFVSAYILARLRAYTIYNAPNNALFHYFFSTKLANKKPQGKTNQGLKYFLTN